jgi:hypothetical protein
MKYKSAADIYEFRGPGAKNLWGKVAMIRSAILAAGLLVLIAAGVMIRNNPAFI